jgi:hypothetical protein
MKRYSETFNVNKASTRTCSEELRLFDTYNEKHWH